MDKPIRFVSCTVNKILDLVAENKLSADAAIELVDVMKANGFVDQHDNFFDAVKRLILKVSDKESNDD